jgi:hypothetical protein
METIKEKTKVRGRTKKNFNVTKNASDTGTKPGETLGSFNTFLPMEKEHLSQINALAYWERKTLKDVLSEALSSHIDAKADTLKQIIEADRRAKEEGRLIKQNMVITARQYELMNTLATRIQWNKQKHPERITINTVIRCLVCLLEDFQAVDVRGVVSEDDLRLLMKKRFLGE